MSLSLIRPTPEHLPQLAHIFFHAFQGISDAHNFPVDIPDLETSAMLMTTLVTRPDFYGIAAIDSTAPSQILGFNFVQISDPVGGVGPICVDPARQSKGLGRLLMQHIIDWSLKNHGPMVRLLQESFNMASLSLYASLGYTVQEPIVLMSIPSAAVADPTVRPLTPADLDACDALCKSIYKISRRNELAIMIQHGPQMACIPHGRFINGHLTAYIIPDFFGYSVATSPDDLLETSQQTARISPPPLHRILIPATHGHLFPNALKRGFKSIKLMNLMSIGPYETPAGAWTPSVAY